MTATLEMVEPSVLLVPDGVSSAGAEAIELAAMAGLILDPWQAFTIDHALMETDAGLWAAFEVAVEVSRQNGKGGILEARELAGLYLFGERLLIHSAHQFDTSLEAFRRLLFLIENTPELDARVARVSKSHGEEGIELKAAATVSTGVGGLRSGERQRIRFRTRTKGGGRGFSGDCVIIDEAMIYPEAAHGALMPTMSARPNPQLWFAGSAVDQEVHEHGIVFSRVRARALRGESRLAYFGWSAPFDHPDKVTSEAASDPDVWLAANPAMPERISPSHIDTERRSMHPRTFAVERLGVGDWPDPEGDAKSVIDLDAWDGLTDRVSVPLDPVWFAVDTSPNRSVTSIAAAGRREDGLVHVEIVERGAGTGWVVARIEELRERHHPSGVVIEKGSPAATLADACQATVVNGQEYVQACGGFFDLIDNRGVRHLGQDDLRDAIRAAATRPLGDAWAWARKRSSGDITGLVAATLAAFKASNMEPHVFAGTWS